MNIYTIGFTKKSAEEFFETLRLSGAKHLWDIRLHNTSQLAGFTKRDDLIYFLKRIVDIEYHEVPILAPEESFLAEYRKTKNWVNYERNYLKLIQERKAEHNVDVTLFKEGVVILCSEAKAEHCHRRLAAEYIAKSRFPNATIVHL